VKPPLFPKVYVACARAALVAMLLIQLYNALGFAGFAYGGKSFSFGRMHDKQMYAIDAERAFLVTGDQHKSVSIVKYKSGFPLFRLCGACETAGGVFPWAHYKKGKWVYTEMPWLKGPAAYDLESGKKVTLDVPDPKSSKIDPEDVPFYAEHGFTFDKSAKIDPETLGESYERLSTVNEMCVILQVAGFIVLFFVLLVGAILLPFGLAKRRAFTAAATRSS
jgi:hypothetical protein